MTRQDHGLTLIELLVAVAILAILATVAAPSFQGLLGSTRAEAAAREFKASLDFARSEAIKQVKDIGICASSNGTSCGADWSSGAIIWVDSTAIDQSGNGSFGSGETVIRTTSITQSNVTISGGVASLIFKKSLGQLSGATNFTFTTGQTTVYICVSASGSSKVQKTTCS